MALIKCVTTAGMVVLGRVGLEVEVSRAHHERRPESGFGGLFAKADAAFVTRSLLYGCSARGRASSKHRSGGSGRRARRLSLVRCR